MDGRTVSGSASYYMHKGVSGSVSETQTGGLNAPPGFRSLPNVGVPRQSDAHGTFTGSTFQIEHSQASFSHGINLGTSSGVSQSQPVKKKRGRPRKYIPHGAMSLGMSPMSAKDLSGSLTPSQKRARGRPPGSGRKQKLAALGEWMNSSAGLAFAPHVLFVAVGEDIASKILLFSQQRPRALCIMSASGSVSAVTLCQPESSTCTVTYEGNFQIVCLSGSYLVSEEGGPSKRTGGLNVSLSGQEGHVIGGVVGGVLIAATPVQVVACSFVYGSSKSNTPKVVKSEHHEGESAALKKITPNQILTSTSGISNWPGTQPLDSSNFHTGTDLMRG